MAAGVGVSLVAELGLTTIREDIVVRQLGRETPVRQIHAATLAGAHRSPATQAMLEILADVATGTRRAGRAWRSSARRKSRTGCSAR